MRVAGLVLGILGGLAAGMPGVKWLSDASEYRAQIEAARDLGVDTSGLTRLLVAGGVCSFWARRKKAPAPQPA
jgi:hypothetical protein